MQNKIAYRVPGSAGNVLRVVGGSVQEKGEPGNDGRQGGDKDIRRMNHSGEVKWQKGGETGGDDEMMKKVIIQADDDDINRWWRSMAQSWRS